MAKETCKKVTLKLVGLDGNAFALMGAFQRQARAEGWDQTEINEVLDECKSGDYSHLLVTLMDHCQEPDDEEDEEFDDDDNENLEYDDEEDE